MNVRTDRKTDRQTERKTDRQTERKTDRQAARTSRLCGAHSGSPQ